jgi:hypothetical protein
MPMEVREIRAFEGPNLYYPQPAVKLAVWTDHDISREISDTLKTWAQVTGLVIGYLRQHVEPSDDGMLITTTWTTPLPTVGARIAQHLVEDLQAAERNDGEYDHDEALFAVINDRKRQEPSLALLQLYAEAQVRDMPVMRRDDGQLVIGSGARGWSFDPAALSLGLGVDVPWDSVGTVPLVAVTGPEATAVTRLLGALLERQGQRVGRADDDGVTIVGTQVTGERSANSAGARRVLTDPQVDVAVVAVSVESILERGLGFKQCRIGVVTGIESMADDTAAVRDERAAAHGIIVLATEPDGTVVLDADDPAVLKLQDWASSPLVLYSEQQLPAASTEHAAGVVYRDGATIHVAINGQHTELTSSHDQPDVPSTAMLAAVAAARTLGIDIATLL